MNVPAQSSGVASRLSYSMLLLTLLLSPAAAGPALAGEMAPEGQQGEPPSFTRWQANETARGIPMGDSCADPVVIPGLPYVDSGDTDLFTDDYDEACPSESTQPDVVYSYYPTEDVLVDISLCGSDYDTKLYVYATCGESPALACNDDGCDGSSRSEIVGLALSGGTAYYVVVDGWGTSPPLQSTYTLSVTVSIVIFTDGFESGNTRGWAETVPPICGDGTQDPGELCDDGYRDECGTCNSDCSSPGTGSFCGDGQHCPETEVCEDGYQDECGTCNSDCSSPGTGSFCGDGQLCPETEYCDDNNDNECGTCNATCDADGTGPTCPSGTGCTGNGDCESGTCAGGVCS